MNTTENGEKTMLYIHKLDQLTMKTAEIESVYIIRDLKQKTPHPFSVTDMQDFLIDFTISATDKQVIEEGLQQVEPALQSLSWLHAEKNSVHEAVNVQRAIQLISEVPAALEANLAYIDSMMAWQESFAAEITPLLNSIPKLKAKDEKLVVNQKVNDIFQKILRNNTFRFHFLDVVNESHINHLAGLHESMNKGYLFRISLEEELKKVDFAYIRQRLPQDKLQEADKIAAEIALIRCGVDRAYDANMRMVNLALVLYAYVKWMMSGV